MNSPEYDLSELIESFMLPANPDLIRCVDDRQALDATNGVELPGGTYGVIDMIKRLKGLDEAEAWEYAYKHGVPIGAHIDDHHHELGCGYGKLVEQNPRIVRAVESVSAAERLERVRDLGGLIMTYVGEHRPTHAVINRRVGTSFDPDQAVASGLGVFNCDTWSARLYAKMLKLNQDRVEDDIEDVYRRTVTALSGIQHFIEIQ